MTDLLKASIGTWDIDQDNDKESSIHLLGFAVYD